MSDPMPQQPPAGWYPDAQGTVRWWDGTRWTEHTQLPAAPPPAAPQAVEQTSVTRYKQRNRWGFHILMTVCTAGLWLVWIPVSMAWNYFRSGKKTYETTVERRPVDGH